MRNGSMSSLDIRAFAAEVRKYLTGARVYKIQQISGAFVLKLNIRSDAYTSLSGREPAENWKRVNLVSVPGRCLALTSESPEASGAPISSIMGMRKALSNAVLEDARQLGTDRILVLKLVGKAGSYQLIIENFGEGNVILTDQDGIIRQALTYRTWSSRAIKPREKYVPPPSDISEYTLDNIRAVLEDSNSDAGRTLALSLNLGPEYSAEVLERCGLNPRDSGKALSQAAEAIYTTISEMIEKAESHESVYFYPDKKAVNPFRMNIYHSEPEIKRTYLDIETPFDMDTEVSSRSRKKDASIKAKNDHAAKLERIIERQKQAMDANERKAKELEAKAEAIYNKWSDLDAIIKSGYDRVAIESQAKEHGMRVESIDMKEKTAIIRWKDNDNEVNVRILLGTDLNQSASAYYHEAGRIRDKTKGARAALKDKTMELERIRKMKNKKKIEEGPTRVKVDSTKRWWFENYRWCLFPSGRVIAAGKDASTNESLVKKHMKTGDLYFHADIHGAPSTLLKRQDAAGRDLGPFTEVELEAATVIAASYSRAWSKGLASFTVYHVLPEQVSNTPMSGEFLAKGSFIIKGKRIYHENTILELAVGIVDIKGKKKVMAGAPYVFTAWGIKDVVKIRPGDINRNDAARKIAQILGVTVADIQPVLPPGAFSIQ